MRPKAPRVGDKCGRQVGDKCKLMRPKAPKVGDKCGRQVGDKCKLMRPKAPRGGDKCEGQVGDKCKLMRPKAPRVGDKCGRQKTSVNSCGPRHPECETSVKDKCGRRVWETSVSCKFMRPKAPRVADRCKLMRPKAPEWDASPETEAKSCGPGMQPFERSKNPIQVNLFGELLQKSSQASKTFFQLLQIKRLQLKLTNSLQNSYQISSQHQVPKTWVKQHPKTPKTTKTNENPSPSSSMHKLVPFGSKLVPTWFL